MSLLMQSLSVSIFVFYNEWSWSSISLFTVCMAEMTNNLDLKFVLVHSVPLTPCVPLDVDPSSSPTVCGECTDP